MSSVLAKQDILNAYHVIFGPVAGAPIDILSYLNPMALKTAYRKKAFETHPDRSLIIGEMEGKMTERVCDKFMRAIFTPPPDAPKNLPNGCSEYYSEGR